MKNQIFTNIKGGQDIPPTEMVLRNRVTDILRKNFESHGYLPLETASLNYLGLLGYKYNDDAEIVREIYKIRDQGERDLGLRFDLTVPFCKFIANNQNLKMPFKRYEIGKVWRNGPVKSGRAREFYQCDVDVVGIEGSHIEAELLSLAIKSYLELGIDVVIKYNNRKLLPYTDAVIGIIDRMAKVTHDEIITDLSKHMSKADAEKLIVDILKTPKNAEILELEKSLSGIKINGKSALDYCEYTPNLARGLNIYTGNVWEAFSKTGTMKSSLGGGGRYDNIIGNFIENGNKYPAVGSSFGLEPIMAVLREKVADGNANPPIDLMLVPLGTESWCQNYANTLRPAKNVLVYLGGKNLSKAFEYASAYGIKNVAVVGDDEVAGKPITIKEIK